MYEPLWRFVALRGLPGAFRVDVILKLNNRYGKCGMQSGRKKSGGVGGEGDVLSLDICGDIRGVRGAEMKRRDAGGHLVSNIA